MDNLTHTLCGAALARTSLGRRSPLSTPALLIAANLPDIDIVSDLFGGHDAYLVHHRGFTHSVAGLAVQTLLFGLLVNVFERRRASARATVPPRRFAALPAIAVGLLSHLLLDWLNNYGVRPWLPFTESRYYGDLVSIIDPWLWLLFGGAALLARPGRAGRVLAAASVLLLLYLGGRDLAREQAWSRAAADLARVLPPAAAVIDHVPQPHPLDPTRWTLVAATQDEIVSIDVRLLGTDGVPQRYPRQLDDPRVQRAAATPRGRAWTYFARMPMAAVTPLPGGGAHVDLMDGRYALQAGPRWSSFGVDLTAADLAAVPPR